MKKWMRWSAVWLGTILLLTPAALGRQGESSQEADPAATYEKLLKELKGGNTEIDYRELRFSYRGPGSTDESLSAMYGALMAMDFKRAAELCEAVLEENYVSIDGHLVCAKAYEGLEDADKAKFHGEVHWNLMASIVMAKGAQKPWNAWQVISYEEEDAVLGAMGYQVQSREDWNDEDGHTFSIVTAETPEGNVVTRYFNQDHYYKRIDEAVDQYMNTQE